MEKIIAALGLPPTATPEQVLAAIDALKTKISAMPQGGPDEVAAEKAKAACKSLTAVLESLGLKAGATDSEITGTITALKAGTSATTDLSKKVMELSQKLASKEADDLIQQALTAGKISPAQTDWAKAYAAKDPEGFKIFVAKSPVVVALGAGKTGTAEPKEGELTEAEKIVCKELGVSEEDFKATKAGKPLAKEAK